MADLIIFVIIPLGFMGGAMLEITARELKKIESSIPAMFLASVLFCIPIFLFGDKKQFMIWTISNFTFFLARSKINGKLVQYTIWIISIVACIYGIWRNHSLY